MLWRERREKKCVAGETCEKEEIICELKTLGGNCEIGVTEDEDIAKERERRKTVIESLLKLLKGPIYRKKEVE